MQRVPPISEGDNQLGRTEEPKMVNDKGLFFLQKKKRIFAKNEQMGLPPHVLPRKSLACFAFSRIPGIDHPYSGTRGSCEL